VTTAFILSTTGTGEGVIVSVGGIGVKVSVGGASVGTTVSVGSAKGVSGVAVARSTDSVPTADGSEQAMRKTRIIKVFKSFFISIYL